MTTQLHHDPNWPRTGGWPAPSADETVDVAVVGVPTFRTSLSPTRANETPAAVRAALRRYAGHLVAPGARSEREFDDAVLDDALRIVDAGDLDDPDSDAGERAATAVIADLARRSQLVIAIGGDNALTVPAALGVAGGDLGSAGLITLDAHHDLRHGRSNGSPVRRLIAAGLDPRRIVQIGIADFANSRGYRRDAERMGITVVHRDELHNRSIEDVSAEALAIAGAAGGPVHVDLDVDVCDRSVAPACPAALPGGIQAHELRRFARVLASSPLVRGIDLAEVDATADTADGRTVRLAALCVLEAAAGVLLRRGV